MKLKPNQIHLSGIVSLSLALACSTSAATFVSLDTYTGYSGQATANNDSPFASIFGSISPQDPDGGVGEITSVYDFRGLSLSVANAGDTYFFLEDVQDGQFDTPGVTFIGPNARTGDGVNGSQNSGSNTDNVAEDTLRRSSFRTTSNPAIRADFNALALGNELPNYVGIVFAERTNQLTRIITAYDSDDNVLETLSVANDGNQVNNGFLGISTTTGISYVTINGDNEFDHFQYGFTPVPEPSSTALLGLGGLALILRRRK